MTTPTPQGGMTRFDPVCDSNMHEYVDGKFIAYTDHAAALAASEARVAELQRQYDKMHLCWSQTADVASLSIKRAEAAEQALAEALPDAERYRWLREGDNDEYVLRNRDGSPVPIESADESPACFLLRNEKLDAAIDAMLLKEDKP